MNNLEKVQAALAALRKRWMETHGGKTPQECRSTLATVTDKSNDESDESQVIEAR